jgi:hypothetical protein
MERGTISAEEFLTEFGKSADPLVAELVGLIKDQPYRRGSPDRNQDRFELDRVLEELEEAVDEPSV